MFFGIALRLSHMQLLIVGGIRHMGNFHPEATECGRAGPV
jgi:hypothetical protein